MTKIYKVKTNGGNEYVAETNEGCWVSTPHVADMLDDIGIWADDLDWTNWGDFFPNCKVENLFDNLNGYECDDPQTVEERDVDE